MTSAKAKTKKPNKGKHPGGRPEKYSRVEILAWEADYLESCQKGMSDRIFLGKKGVDRTYLWARIKRDIPEFSDILKKGKAYQEEFYTKLGLAGASGQLKNFNVGAFVWTTKHMLGWWDQPKEEAPEGEEAGTSSKVTYKSRFAGDVES